MSTEDARVVRALVVGTACGLTFWVALYAAIRQAVEHFRR